MTGSSPIKFSLRFMFCVASLTLASCGGETAEQRALRLEEARESAREARAIMQACITLDTHWSLDPDYEREGGVERCAASTDAKLAQLQGRAPANKLRRAKQIRELQAAACEIGPESDQC